MTRHDPRIAVVGGGISGLSAALELALGTEGRADIALLESQERAGGVIRTSEFAGLPVDEGADAFLRRVPDALEVAAAVGMRDLTAPTGASAAVWVDRLRPLPEGLRLGVPTSVRSLVRSRLVSPRGSARALADLVLPSRGLEHDSIGTWVRARLGSEVHDSLIDALVVHQKQPILAKEREAEELRIKKEELQKVNTRVLELQDRALDLSLSATFKSKIGTTTDENVATAAVKTEADTGTYDLNVSALATAHRVAGIQHTGNYTTPIGTFSINGITIVSDDNLTLEGFRDAVNLGWKLPLVLGGQCDESLLDTYAAERDDRERNPHTSAALRASLRGRLRGRAQLP